MAGVWTGIPGESKALKQANIQTSCEETELVPHPSPLQAHSDARCNCLLVQTEELKTKIHF